MLNCDCSTACDLQQRTGKKLLCPDCGRKGKNVGRHTIAQMLKTSLVAEISEDNYYFCVTPDCETVYFAFSPRKTFRKPDLKVRVGIKETDDPIPICYCFGHTRASVWQEIEQTGTSTVLESIKREVKAGRCRCEAMNPSGKCCLGEVTRVVQALHRLGDANVWLPVT